MRLNSILGVMVSTIVVAGCADGNSVLSLNLSTPDTLTGVDHVTITVTDTARNAKSKPARYAVPGGMIPPAQQVALVLPAKVRGAVHVDASVEAADGTVLGLGGGDYTVTPSKQSTGDLVVRSIDALPDAAMSTVTVDRSTGVAANGADSAVVSVTLVNLHGTPLPGVTVQIAATGTGTSLSTPDPTGPNGVTTASIRSIVVETKTITASALGITLMQQPTVQFVSGGVATLAFSVQPIKSYAGKVMSAVKVQIQDDQGNVIPTATNTIALSLSPNSANASLIGIPTGDAVAGVATFDVIGVDKSGQGFTLVASTQGLSTTTSAAFNIVDYPWQLVTGLQGGLVYQIVAAPGNATNPVSLYAETQGDTWRSTDLAATWTRADFGQSAATWLPGNGGWITADPSTPGTAYLSTGTSSPVPGAFILKTTNGGKAWSNYSTGATGNSAVAVAVNPSNSAIVYAGNDVGLFKSTDGGKHWAQTSFGYSVTWGLLAVDQVTPSIVYAVGRQVNVGSKGIFRSTDSGASWAPINSGIPTLVIQELYAFASGVFAVTQSTVYRSTDNGTTWTNLAIPAPDNLYAAPSNPMIVYSSSGNTVKKSSDGGMTFPTSFTISASYGTLEFLAVHPTNPNELFVGTTFGVYHSTDTGATWTAASVGIANLSISALTIQQSNIVVGTSFMQQTYRSTDLGATWTGSTMDPNDTSPPKALAPDPDGVRIYLCTGAFHVSLDGAATWSSAAIPGDCGSALFANTGGTPRALYVGASPGIFKSTDAGTTWTSTPILAQPTTFISGTINVATPTVFAAVSPKGVYRSGDAGSTWTNVQTTDVVTGIVIDDNNTTQAFLGSNCTTTTGDTGGFRISNDGGMTWGSLVKPGTCVTGLINVGHLMPLMATASVNSVATFLSSSDKGQTWTSIPLGTSARIGSAVIAASDGQHVFVGTSAGLYYSATGGF
jgi:photosystem II stability/assembly factor-like uncharacterized protein